MGGGCVGGMTVGGLTGPDVYHECFFLLLRLFEVSGAIAMVEKNFFFPRGWSASSVFCSFSDDGWCRAAVAWLDV